MSSTLDQSTLTYVTISSESKWKIEWLNSTSWKRTINLRTFLQKHYQENSSNFFFHTWHESLTPETSQTAFKKRKISKQVPRVLGVRVNFTSQSTTTVLSIDNGSLFEGESELEKLKIYLITLVSIRSDWEDLPWLFRNA
ncbi:hypothetical protein Tco_0266331 [Tanacetum coccineum]